MNVVPNICSIASFILSIYAIIKAHNAKKAVGIYKRGVTKKYELSTNQKLQDLLLSLSQAINNYMINKTKLGQRTLLNAISNYKTNSSQEFVSDPEIKNKLTKLIQDLSSIGIQDFENFDFSDINNELDRMISILTEKNFTNILTNIE